MGDGPKRSRYHAIKDLAEGDIRSLSKVIENSIVTSMAKNKSLKRVSSQKELEDKKKQEEDLKREKEYLAQVRYGVSEIDNNFELKKFLV